MDESCCLGFSSCYWSFPPYTNFLPEYWKKKLRFIEHRFLTVSLLHGLPPKVLPLQRTSRAHGHDIFTHHTQDSEGTKGIHPMVSGAYNLCTQGIRQEKLMPMLRYKLKATYVGLSNKYNTCTHCMRPCGCWHILELYVISTEKAFQHTQCVCTVQ